MKNNFRDIKFWSEVCDMEIIFNLIFYLKSIKENSILGIKLSVSGFIIFVILKIIIKRKINLSTKKG